MCSHTASICVCLHMFFWPAWLSAMGPHIIRTWPWKKIFSGRMAWMRATNVSVSVCVISVISTSCAPGTAAVAVCLAVGMVGGGTGESGATFFKRFDARDTTVHCSSGSFVFEPIGECSFVLFSMAASGGEKVVPKSGLVWNALASADPTPSGLNLACDLLPSSANST